MRTLPLFPPVQLQLILPSDDVQSTLMKGNANFRQYFTFPTFSEALCCSIENGQSENMVTIRSRHEPPPLPPPPPTPAHRASSPSSPPPLCLRIVPPASPSPSKPQRSFTSSPGKGPTTPCKPTRSPEPSSSRSPHSSDHFPPVSIIISPKITVNERERSKFSMLLHHMVLILAPLPDSPVNHRPPTSNIGRLASSYLRSHGYRPDDRQIIYDAYFDTAGDAADFALSLRGQGMDITESAAHFLHDIIEVD